MTPRAYDKDMSMPRRGSPQLAEPCAIKKSRTSGLFWGLLWNNMTYRFSAGRH